MKDLFKFLPQILEILPRLLGNIKGIVILIVVLSLLGGIGFAAFTYFSNYKDPYRCYNNEIYERMSFDSGVYKFKGGYCIDHQQK
jgi:hypothetical protein